MHIVITNGPPFSGKDTTTKHILERIDGSIWMRFKNVLYKETWKDLFVHGDDSEITLDEWIEICNDIKLKDQALPYNLSNAEIQLWKQAPDVYGNNIYCKSPRRHLIDKSEKDLKVKYGDGGVAVITSGYIKEIENYKDKVIIFSDGGFNVEIDTLCEELELTRKDITIVRIDSFLNSETNELCNFKNDSREYILNPDISIFNDKTDNFYKIIDNEVIPLILKRIKE